MEDEKLAEARAAFELDGKGNVILRPVLGWHCMPAAGMLVLLKLNYAQTPAEFRGEEKARDFQIALTPNQALENARHGMLHRVDGGIIIGNIQPSSDKLYISNFLLECAIGTLDAR